MWHTSTKDVHFANALAACNGLQDVRALPAQSRNFGSRLGIMSGLVFCTWPSTGAHPRACCACTRPGRLPRSRCTPAQHRLTVITGAVAAWQTGPLTGEHPYAPRRFLTTAGPAIAWSAGSCDGSGAQGDARASDEGTDDADTAGAQCVWRRLDVRRLRSGGIWPSKHSLCTTAKVTLCCSSPEPLTPNPATRPVDAPGWGCGRRGRAGGRRPATRTRDPASRPCRCRRSRRPAPRRPAQAAVNHNQFVAGSG